MFKELLSRTFAPFGTLSPEHLVALERHWELLNSWNRRLNLTRIIDLESAVKLHYCESLYLGLSIPDDCQRVVDIGSGAGFPGIPLGIFRPTLQIDLVESHQRKAVFLREAARELPNIRVVAKRGEDLQKDSCDLVISRAVRPLDVLNLSLAPHSSILITRAELETLPPAENIRDVPWGRDRVIATFHVKRDKI